MSAERVYEIIDRARTLAPYSLEKIELLREAVREADAGGLVDAGFDAREELTLAATFGGESLDIVIHFGWMLARSDESPDRFPQRDVLWRYKWVAQTLPSFPEVPRERIDAVLEDLNKRFEAIGSTGRPRWGTELDVRSALGDRELAAKAYERWMALPRDHLSDCPACERNREVNYAAFVRDDVRTIAAAQRVFLGRGCMEVPHATHGTVLIPLLRQRRVHEGETHHRQGWKMIQPIARDMIGAVSEHVSFAALTGNHDRAARFLVKHLPTAIAIRQQRPRMELLEAGALLAELMLAAGRRSLSLPQDVSSLGLVPKTGRSHALGEVRDRFRLEAQAIAARFDARAGNDHVARDLEARRAWRDLAVDYPITG